MSYVVQFLMCYTLWVLLVWPFRVGIGGLVLWAGSGFEGGLAVMAPGAGQDLLAGILVAGLAAVLFGHVFPRHPERILHPMRYLWFLEYVPVFVYACVLANLDVAYRVLHLRLPIRPGIVKVRTTLKSEMGRVILAHTIALLPGTLVIDMVGQDMYVHWINVSAESPQQRADIILGRFEDILKRVFD